VPHSSSGCFSKSYLAICSEAKLNAKIRFWGKWYRFVSKNRRQALLEILAEISRLYQVYRCKFILVGACSLLIRGCLKYKAWWDVDLLFRSPEDISHFQHLPVTEQLQVFPVDHQLQDYGDVSSWQNMWGSQNVWYRVDLIHRPRYYLFHLSAPSGDIFYHDTIYYQGKIYHINLPVAHPWNMFVDKLLSPRLAFELETGGAYSIDIRHLFILYSLYRREDYFWDYVVGNSSKLGALDEFKKNLKILFQKKDEFGYQDIKINPEDLKRIESR